MNGTYTINFLLIKSVTNALADSQQEDHLSE